MNQQMRTSTLQFGPFAKPLSNDDVRMAASCAAKAIGLGYAVAKMETDQSLTVIAVITAPVTQPFTRVRDLEATAHQEHES